jgi:hypothetical protein
MPFREINVLVTFTYSGFFGEAFPGGANAAIPDGAPPWRISNKKSQKTPPIRRASERPEADSHHKLPSEGKLPMYRWMLFGLLVFNPDFGNNLSKK